MNTTIRPLTESDLTTSRRIISLAFGTFLGAPEPETFWSDLDYARPAARSEHPRAPWSHRREPSPAAQRAASRGILSPGASHPILVLRGGSLEEL